MIRQERKYKIDNSKPLFLPLNVHWFEEFKSGRKTVEYRALSRKFTPDNCVVGREVLISRGYNNLERLRGVIKSVEIIDNEKIPKEEYSFLLETLGSYDFHHNMYLAIEIELFKDGQ